MKAIYDVLAPAKLNLFLHITGRRPDGYHLLQSVFMLIDWCDTLHFERRPQARISREDLGAPLPADDLIVRAARLLQSHTGCSQGAHISVDKDIPAQAGMGGGSSDAASTLLALNRLWQLGLSLPQLETLGLQLGADVPFFLRGRNAWVEGIGEHITPLDLPPARLAVIKPASGLETRLIFSSANLKRDEKPATISGFAANQLQNGFESCFDFGRNGLQPVAEALCPDVSRALAWLECRGLRGRMTGSGSAVFAPVASDVAWAGVPSDWRVRVCSNLDVHPLAGWAASES